MRTDPAGKPRGGAGETLCDGASQPRGGAGETLCDGASQPRGGAGETLCDGASQPRGFDAYAFKPHPLVPLPPAEELARDMADPGRQAAALAFLTSRAKLLRLDEADPLWHKLRLPSSRDLDKLLCQYQMVYESGGNRAGKTEDGVPRFLRSCFKYGKAKRWAMQDNALSSIANLQQLFWKYLPESVKVLNGARTRKQRQQYRVHYSPDGGFDGLLILPNGCEIYFLNYTQQPSDFLGWELGKDVERALDPEVPDIGALLDENCPLTWLENIQLRCSTRGAKIHWMYSPQEGITPAIRDLKSNARTVATRPAELLRETVNVPGLPRGEMPYIQVDEKKKLAIFYRFTEVNPFSGYDRTGGVRDLCLGKANKDYTMRHAYGYCEAVRGRAFPLFGEWNVVRAGEVPAAGTNYSVTDPHGAKNWFTIWARACPGRPGDLYIYREWPDYEQFGDWAVTSANPRKLNGDRGPAVPTIGLGPAQYKNLFLRLERIHVPKQQETSPHPGPLPQGGEGEDAGLDARLKTVADPHHRWRIKEAIKHEEDLEKLTESIFERLIDPRAARNQNATERGGIDLLTKLAQENRNEKTGVVEAAPMYFTPAPGLDLREGLSQINELLYFDQTQERVSIINAPRLYVSEKCRNTIWALQNYCLPTDEQTTDDACEEPIDCLRYLVTRGARYIEAGGRVKTY